jgi:uncharacterized protein YybS (DUF2232 family)
LIFAVEQALPAWYLGWRIRAGRGIVPGSALSALAVTLLLLGGSLLLAGRGQDPVQALEEQLRQSLAELNGAGPGAGTRTEGTAALAAGFEEVLSFVRRVLPAVTVIGVFIQCSVNSVLAARVLAFGGGPARALAMTRFKLPEWLVWVLIPALALCWAPQRAVATVALNALLPLLLGYLLQGLSITLYLAERVRLSRFARALCILGLAFFPWMLAVPLTLGLLDFRFDFRGRWPPAPPPA